MNTKTVFKPYHQMMKLLIFIIFLSVNHFNYGQSEQQINNLATFAKLYGYVKYFHPSDEAASIDWNKFAIYGCRYVENAKDTDDLLAKLDSLFRPIAPTILLMKENQKKEFDIKTMTPAHKIGYKVIAWQHFGNGIDTPIHYVYKSRRVNSNSLVNEGADHFGSLSKTINIEKYRNKKIMLSGYVKINEETEVIGRLWLGEKKERISDFEMDSLMIKKKCNSWKQYKVITEVDNNAKYISFGFTIIGKGQVFIDDLQLFYEEGDQWIEIPIANSNFETATWSDKKNSWNKSGKGYAFDYENDEFISGSNSLSIKFVGVPGKNRKLFDKYPKAGETIHENIGSGIYLILPIALYGNKKGTYPKSNKDYFLKLKKELKKNNSTDIMDIHTRTADIIITWNIFQHFYPYFDLIKTDWNKELIETLKNSYKCKTKEDFYLLLISFTATLHDGHSNSMISAKSDYQLPLRWEWLENKLVITKVASDSLPVKAGDIVVKINNQDAKDYFEAMGKNVSAATEGYKYYRLEYLTLCGEKDSRVSLNLQNGDNIELFRTKKSYGLNRTEFTKFKFYSNDIVYLNLNCISMNQIDSLLPELTKAKSIICDLRFYPNYVNDFIPYLLEKPDTAAHFCLTPEIIYPDFKNNGYSGGCNNIPVKKPHLTAKIIFIIDVSAISWAETYMCYIQGYKLATIVGQPTAGTDGNVQFFELPGGIEIRYTGQKFIKLDGSQLFGIGVLPDIYVNKTIKGVLEGRDEYLDKALEIANMN